MTADFIVNLIWFGLGLGLGYALGVAHTALRVAERMERELVECLAEIQACHQLIEEGSAHEDQ